MVVSSSNELSIRSSSTTAPLHWMNYISNSNRYRPMAAKRPINNCWLASRNRSFAIQTEHSSFSGSVTLSQPVTLMPRYTTVCGWQRIYDPKIIPDLNFMEVRMTVRDEALQAFLDAAEAAFGQFAGHGESRRSIGQIFDVLKTPGTARGRGDATACLPASRCCLCHRCQGSIAPPSDRNLPSDRASP